MIWVIGFVFVAYTVMGGLVSVAWTDLIQGTVMVTTVLVALVFIIIDQGSLTAINTQFTQLSAANTMPLGDGAYTLLGLAGSLVAFFGTIFTAQGTIIRINATKDIRTAKIHLAFGGLILSVFYSALILLGGGVTVALENAGLAGFENVDQAFPIFITDYLPTGIGIVVILAVMSAILSTTDTRLHSTGVTTARDIYDWYADDASDQQLMKVSRIATIFWGVTATAMAVDPPGTIITLYTFRAILLTSAFLIPIYLGLYWTGVAGNAIIVSIVVGTLLGVGWDLSGGFLGVPATFMGVGGAFLALLVGHLVWSESGGGRTSVAAGD
jgi:sodium/proline symporter